MTKPPDGTQPPGGFFRARGHHRTVSTATRPPSPSGMLGMPSGIAHATPSMKSVKQLMPVPVCRVFPLVWRKTDLSRGAQNPKLRSSVESCPLVEEEP